MPLLARSETPILPHDVIVEMQNICVSPPLISISTLCFRRFTGRVHCLFGLTCIGQYSKVQTKPSFGYQKQCPYFRPLESLRRMYSSGEEPLNTHESPLPPIILGRSQALQCLGYTIIQEVPLRCDQLLCTAKGLPAFAGCCWTGESSRAQRCRVEKASSTSG
jgi:hypothetical protein